MILPMFSGVIIRPGEEREVTAHPTYPGFLLRINYTPDKFVVRRAFLRRWGSGVERAFQIGAAVDGWDGMDPSVKVESRENHSGEMSSSGDDVCLSVSYIGSDLRGEEFFCSILFRCPDPSDPTHPALLDFCHSHGLCVEMNLPPLPRWDSAAVPRRYRR